jgi:DNA-directed RNA polymerase subunit RPC12/RpoP
LKTENLLRFLDNVEKLGYDSEKVVQLLSRMDDLEEETNRTQKRLDSTTHLCVQEEQRLNQAQTATTNASANLESIKQMKTKTEADWIVMLQKTQEASHQIEFAKAVCLLFGDISQIPPHLLLELAEMLKMIVQARLNPTAIYPIDFGLVRQKAISLLEYALGKSLVTREQFDDLLKRLGERHDDLVFLDLTKMERKHNALTKWEAELAVMTNAVEHASIEKILSVAVNAQAEALIRVYKCLQCGRPLAAVSAGVKSIVFKCPSCGYATPQQ